VKPDRAGKERCAGFLDQTFNVGLKTGNKVKNSGDIFSFKLYKNRELPEIY